MIPVRSNIRDLNGYTPGEQFNDPDIIKLNTNENPYPPSPRVFEAVQAALTGDKLRKYPQPLADDFRRVAGQVLKVDPSCILVGNGSDDILTILTRAFVPEGGLMVSPTPSYLLYRTLAGIQGARFECVPYTADWQLDLNQWPRHANLCFVANPNSPSGTLVEPAVIRHLSSLTEPSPLVVDEAYVEFSDAVSLIHRIGEWPNLIVTRTFSKAYSLAGMRLGYAVARPEVIRELVKVKDSYNCDVLSLAAATAAIEDQHYFTQVRAKILATRERMLPALTALGFVVTPSQANFVWCRRSDRAVLPIYEELKRRKILVRYMNYDGYDGLRISVGTDAEIDRLITELRAIL
jgi:histidinol-phosphate aminotransferase